MSGHVRLQTIDPFPFDTYPQLRTIWPAESQRLAVEASESDWHTGSVFYIVRNSQIVGLTGMFFEDGDDDHVFLRWHGVVPTHRGYSIGGIALAQIINMARYMTRAKYLIELVPDTEEGKRIEAWFRLNGFTDVDHELAHEQHDHQKVKPLMYSLERQ